GEPRDPRRREQTERDGGQDEVLEAAAPRRREPAPVHGEDQDQHDAEPEGRKRLPQERDDRRDVVHRRIASDCRDDARGNRESERDHQRRPGQLERGRHPLHDQTERRFTVTDGLAEVALESAAQKAAVLYEERIVEAHRLPEALDVFSARVRREQHGRRIPGQMQDEEDDERDTEQDDERLGEPTDEVRGHARRRRATASMWGVCGNMSTGCTHSSRYPCRNRSPTSRASVAGLHETYTMRTGASATNACNALG